MAMVTISPEFRTMSIPTSQRVLGCVGDVAVRRVGIDAPRYVDGHDMSGWRFRVHYRMGETADRHEVVDAEVGEKRITFSWEPRHWCFESAGTVTAAVEAALLDGDGAVVREFNTQPGGFVVRETVDSEPMGARIVNEDGAYVVFGYKEGE